jgi:hypothetical protein
VEDCENLGVAVKQALIPMHSRSTFLHQLMRVITDGVTRKDGRRSCRNRTASGVGGVPRQIREPVTPRPDGAGGFGQLLLADSMPPRKTSQGAPAFVPGLKQVGSFPTGARLPRRSPKDEGGRKVRTPKGSAPGNARAGQPDGPVAQKIHSRISP